MAKAKQTTESIVGRNKEFLAYRNKLESLTIPKKGQDLNHKHLILVGGSAEEAKPFAEDIRGLGFKQRNYVECSNTNTKALKEEIYNKMYTYFSKVILKDSYKDLGRASTGDILNKSRNDKRGAITLGNYCLCILNNVSSVNNDLWCELAVTIGREKNRQYILIATVASQKELKKLPGTWQDRELFEIVPLDGEGAGVKSSGATIESGVEQQEAKDEKSLPKERQCIFQKRDDVYRILYAHESFTLEATDGFKYIRYLLEHPYDAGDRIKAKNKFIPNQLFVKTQELLPHDVGIDTGKKGHRRYDIEPFSKDEAMTVFGDHMNPELDKDTGEEGRDPGSGFKGGRHGDYTEEVVDKETKQKIRELENERDIAKTTRNKEKADRVQADIDDIKKGYLHHIMKGGKSRRFVSSFHKKPYDNISQAMNVVYDKIKKHSEAKDYKSMLTWKHLKSSIKFKHSCFFYEPETLPDWIL